MIRNFLRAFALLSCLSIAIVVCMSSIVLTNLLTRTTAAAQPAPSRIVYGLTLLPSGFDPHINASAELGIPLRSVYDTLVYRDPVTKAFVPGLAERWDISPDGLVYTFYLRRDVRFHDGEPFNALAVAANLDRITAPETRSQKAAFLLGSYERYIVLDEYTIQLVLKTPYAPLLDSLSQVYLGIASPKALREYGTDLYQLHQVGTGPYQMVEFIPGDYILLRRNPSYRWGPSFYRTDNPAPVEEIEFRFFTDPATRAPALESGAVDIIGELPPLDALALARRDDITLIPQPIPGMPLQFFFNTGKAPTDRLDVRRAIITATDRVAIIDSVFQQLSPVAYGPLTAVTPFYEPQIKQYYPHDREVARQTLTELGYRDNDGDKILDLNGAPLRLIVIVPTWGYVPQVAQRLQSQWREQGIDVELRQVPNLAGLLAAVQSGEYHLVAFNDFGADPSLLNNFYLSEARNNFMRVSNANLDQWLRQAAQINDPAQRQNFYTGVQGLIMDQALILPIRDYVNLNAHGKRVSGLAFDAYGWFPLLANLTFVGER
ncbi:MAG: ABC transporter substrate-binding protein [Anaerolineae bacterium]|nr:ABC transporter substrate-binding protein [Anaerolineae bacterium]MDW8299535.1 ABC transporter substrate-binding protein [Anaerolineae bacterium]